jgi:hypothetical protein
VNSNPVGWVSAETEAKENDFRRFLSMQWPSHLTDHVLAIGKKQVIVREPRGANQYTFIFLTNYLKFPAWEKAGFYHLESEEGSQIMSKLDMSAREMQERDEAALIPTENEHNDDTAD